jgi:hypothetical protein
MTVTPKASSTNGNVMGVIISSTQTPIARCPEADGPKRGRNKIETTDLASGLVGEDSIAGILRGKTSKFKIWIDPNGATDAYLEASLAGGTTEKWFYQLSNVSTSKYSFSGWITTYELGSAKVDGLQEADIEIQPCLTPGSPPTLVTLTV